MAAIRSVLSALVAVDATAVNAAFAFCACAGESASRMSVPYLLLSPFIGRPAPQPWSAARRSCISSPLSRSICFARAVV